MASSSLTKDNERNTQGVRVSRLNKLDGSNNASSDSKNPPILEDLNEWI